MMTTNVVGLVSKPPSKVAQARAIRRPDDQPPHPYAVLSHSRHRDRSVDHHPNSTFTTTTSLRQPHLLALSRWGPILSTISATPGASIHRRSGDLDGVPGLLHVLRCRRGWTWYRSDEIKVS